MRGTLLSLLFPFLSWGQQINSYRNPDKDNPRRRDNSSQLGPRNVQGDNSTLGDSWDYATVSGTGKFCPERDSCNFGRHSRGSLELDWKSRNCFCDNDCSLYGDCCIDARVFDNRLQKENYGQSNIISTFLFGFYLIFLSFAYFCFANVNVCLQVYLVVFTYVSTATST